MKCARKDCGRPVRSAGLCEQHYAQYPSGFVDAESARRHLTRLKNSGYGWDEIAHLTGLSREGLRGVAQFRNTRITADTKQRIFAVRVPALPVPGKGLVPSLPSQRRLRALMAVGYSQPYIGELLGKPTTSVSRILYRDWVQAPTAAVLAELYERVAMVPGPSRITRVRAAKRGFAPPLAWDNIDDPNEKPDIGVHRRTPFSERIRECHEDLGMTDVHAIAERLGMQPESVERQMYRNREDAA